MLVVLVYFCEIEKGALSAEPETLNPNQLKRCNYASVLSSAGWTHLRS